jgi:hypothetical protein
LTALLCVDDPTADDDGCDDEKTEGYAEGMQYVHYERVSVNLHVSLGHRSV